MQHSDGIYFNMPEAEYHAIPRLSASGIQAMMVSPATFWARSWLNPEREEEEDTSFQILGRAYHCARLEPGEFFSRYCRELDKADFEEDLITSDAGIKAALKDMGLPQTQGAETVLERAQRLRDAGCLAPIWHLELAAWEHDRGERQGIPAKAWQEILRDMKRLRQNPEVSELLSDGAAEVSILWTCEETGVKLKARLDYLKPDRVVDFKTFDNSMGRALEDAILNAFRFNRYYIQGALYWQAVEEIRRSELAIIGDFTEAQLSLVQAIRENKSRMRCFYVFQEKKGIPNILAREYGLFHGDASLRAAAPSDEAYAEAAEKYGNPSMLHRKAELEIGWCKRTFLQYQEIYPDGLPWFPINMMGRIEDESYPINWLESDR